ncbi:MAG TPA: dTDP-4-amino-4,6-dideoxygalactose transaminase [Opitutaceae bacterium]|nr:dTDP-4-amino-4,6-dideoxygalactose transaminase [Opitutaceae bacterium]
MAAISFNVPHLTGRELEYAKEAFQRGHTAGNGLFTARCHALIEERYRMRKVLLTQSCTSALEMSALLAEIGPGDEVIVPSFTFVSTANAFALRGASIVFADSLSDHPNIDPEHAASLVSSRTRAIVPVHYAGVACDMDRITETATIHGLTIIEDAAQAIDAYHKNRPLGTFGRLAAFSFHETKNIISGEGGMLVVNDAALDRRAEIVWEKGTNRAAFFRGEIDKYGWVDVGSSFLPSEITAAFLLAQLEHVDDLQARRQALWEGYRQRLQPLATQGHLHLPTSPAYARHNAHIFYLVCRNLEERTALSNWLKSQGIEAVFHYQALHLSKFHLQRNARAHLPNAEAFSDRLLRLPLYFDLTESQLDYIADCIAKFYVRFKSICA